MNHPQSNIKRVVDHVGGMAELSRRLDGYPVQQEIQRWVARGWASPHHLFRLEPFLPKGVKVRDLAADRDRVRSA